jgi:hypothetical protein
MAQLFEASNLGIKNLGIKNLGIKNLGIKKISNSGLKLVVRPVWAIRRRRTGAEWMKSAWADFCSVGL